jgi:RNA polymerase sigma factor (sigma-70 family)
MTCDDAPESAESATDLRRAAARAIAALTSKVGAARLDLVEDATQDALLRALKTWPERGVPEDPEAWIVRVARNALIDRLRRDVGGAEAAAALAETRQKDAAASAADEASRREDPTSDPMLGLLFVCCRPELSRASRVALSLRECCGLSVREIAAALRVPEAAVAKRLTRAKLALRDRGVSFKPPESSDLRERLDDVLDAIYALFTEGGRATTGGGLVRIDLVMEALRLARTLSAAPLFDAPRTRALRALICLHAARLPARVGADGGLLTLAEQDRSLFDRDLLNEGFAAFEASLQGDEVSRFHVEASIASLHACAPSFEATDWAAVLDRYDALLRIAPGPVAALNRVVAVAVVRGVEEARAALDAIATEAALVDDGLVRATRAFLDERSGAFESAAAAWRDAAAFAKNPSEAAYCVKRAEEASKKASAEATPGDYLPPPPTFSK